MPAKDGSGGPTLKAIRLFWLAAAASLVVDLISKALVFDSLGGVAPEGHVCDQSCGHYLWVLPNALRFVCRYNFGGAFSWAAGNTLLFVGAAAVLVPVLVLAAYYCRDPKAPLWALGLVVGGAVGNLYDRVFHPGVRDFIEVVNPKTMYPLWPVFNIADIAIVAGVAVYLLWSLVDSARKKRPVGANGA